MDNVTQKTTACLFGLNVHRDRMMGEMGALVCVCAGGMGVGGGGSIVGFCEYEKDRPPLPEQ